MPGTMAAAIGRRQLRFIGNKNTIPSKHAQGNKGGFGPPLFGRAASSQDASGPKNAMTYQGGATFSDSSKPSGDPVQKGKANKPTANRSAVNDMAANKLRGRTPPGAEKMPFSIGAVARRQGGK